MFGAWQAGVWRALAGRFQPDLIVGASVGSLNGYAIAGGADPDELCDLWRRPELAHTSELPEIIHRLMARYPPQRDYALVVTDLLRMKPKTFSGSQVSWRHLAASCAVPFVRPVQRIDGCWYADGGILNPLPLWAAAELGATHIVAVNVLPQVPSMWLKPFVKGFRLALGYHPPLPAGIALVTIKTPKPLGSTRDTFRWRRENVERWLAEGYEAAKNISLPICPER
jgi:predicted acylesterase/phospholipase RssA